MALLPGRAGPRMSPRFSLPNIYPTYKRTYLQHNGECMRRLERRTYLPSTETEAYIRKYARSGTSASREALGMAGRRKRLLSSLIIFGEAAEALLF